MWTKDLDDLISKGIWAKLSHPARCVYPVAREFKGASTATIIKYSGLCKNAVLSGLRELIAKGLLPERKTEPGYIYIASNLAYSGVLKIGFTVRDPHLRLKELEATGLLTPFKLEHHTPVEGIESERKLHKELAAHRVNNRREFFRIELQDAINIVSKYQR